MINISKKKKREVEKVEIEKLTNFLLGMRTLKYLPRASVYYLKGPIKENVAEHCYFTTLIAWILAKLERAVDDKVIKMCLIHDIAEVRVGDKPLIHKFYSRTLDEVRITREIINDYDMDKFKINAIFKEFWQQRSKEAKVAHDADILSQMMWEKENLDLGNKKAQKWVIFSLSRLKTKSGKELGKQIKKADSDEWWVEIVKKYILKTQFL